MKNYLILPLFISILFELQEVRPSYKTNFKKSDLGPQNGTKGFPFKSKKKDCTDVETGGKKAVA